MSKFPVLQQGDVLLYSVTTLPTGLVKAKDNVVQEGEFTGHAHRLNLQSGDTELLLDEATNTKYLNVKSATMLSHEEHNTIVIPPGLYKTDIVQEYDHFAEEARRVQD